MKVSFEVKPFQGKFDVFVMVDKRVVEVRQFQSTKDIEAAAPAMIAKAQALVADALTVQEKLNKLVE